MFSWLAGNPILSFSILEPRDTVTNQLVVGSAVSHEEPVAKRERWSRAREADKKAHGADKKDHRASESQRRTFGFYNCSFYSLIPSNLVPMLMSLPDRALPSVSYNCCSLTWLRVGLCLIYFGVSLAQSRDLCP